MNWPLLQNSLLVSGAATLLAVAFGLVVALWLACLSPRVRNVLLAPAIVAFALPPFLVTGIWIDLLGQTGIWHRWLPLNIYSLGGTAWVLALLTWPVTLFAALGSWLRLDPAQLESDPVLAGWLLVRCLLLPVARAALGLAAVLTFVLALNNFAVPAILQTKVFPAEIWLRFNTTFDTASALQLSWPLIIAPLLLLALFRGREWNWPDAAGQGRARALRHQLGRRWFGFCAVTGTLVLALSAALPLARLLGTARTWIELPGAFAASQPAVLHSFTYAAVTATLTVVLGLWLGQRGRIGLLLWVFFLVPGVLLGIGLIVLLNRPPFIAFYQSAGVVVLALTVRHLALGWNGSVLAMRRLDRDLTDAARLDGASRWQIFSQVQWPQIAPLVFAAWYIVYLLCLWDVETLVLVIPPGGETLALRVFNLLHYGHNAQVNALCLLLLTLAVLPLLAVVMFVRTRHFFKFPPGKPPHPPLDAHGNHETFSTVAADVSRLQSPAGKNERTHVRCYEVQRECSSRVFTNAATFVLLATALLWAGCAPPGDSTEPANEARWESGLFSRVEVIGSRGTGAGQFNKPRSLAVDRADNLYVIDMTGRLQKFSPQGAFLASYQMPETAKGAPKGMCRDSEGNIVVVETHYARIKHFSPDLKLVRQWGNNGTNAGQLAFPRAAVVNSQGEIFISEYMYVERVQRFALESVVSSQSSVAKTVVHSGRQPPTDHGLRTTDQPPHSSARFITGFGHEGQGPGAFNRVEGLGIDALDRVYVADSCNHRIQVFSPDGKLQRIYGRAGRGVGELSYPYDICLDKAGRQYVCEFGNSRVQIFDAQDHPIEILGGVGAAPGRMSNPWAIAFDSKENLYVADGGNHRVLKFIRKEPVVRSQWSAAKTTGSSARLTANTTDYGLLATDCGRLIPDP